MGSKGEVDKEVGKDLPRFGKDKVGGKTTNKEKKPSGS